MGFEVWGRLGMDGSGWTQGLNKANREASGFQKQLEGGFANTANAIKGQLAAAFGFGALANRANAVVQYAGEITDLSAKLNVSTDTLQKWDFAFGQNGATLNDVSAALRNLAKEREAALGGNAKSQGLFAAVGIDLDKLKSLDLEGTFRAVSDSFNSTDFGASELALATELLGI